MRFTRELSETQLGTIGRELHGFAADLYPICRSITGDGIRCTLSRIEERIPLCVAEVPTGTQVFDWTVPNEWNIRAGYLKGPDGKTIVDFHDSNLHVLNYSLPVRGTMSLRELRPHLYSLPEHPDCIPYRTSYYEEKWGFCLPHRQLQALPDGNYEAHIDSTLAPGNLTYGECYLPGRSSEEVLFSCHACHPSLANDNLSGLSLATALAQFLSGRELRYSYRFLFIPGTIGAITWLARNRAATARIAHGLVLTCLGDAGGFHYKKSRRGNAPIDRAVEHALMHCGEPFKILDFSPYGYDERQYCSPGFNLPVGCLMRSHWGKFPEYHTSADNLDFIRPESLARSFGLLATIIDMLEHEATYCNQNQYCEPQLGRRNLYRSTGGDEIGTEIAARLWVLNGSDGQQSLIDIARKSGLPFAVVADAAELLHREGLLAALPVREQ